MSLVRFKLPRMGCFRRDHKIPRALSGKDEYKNLQLLHRHCHDEKTAFDLIEIRKKDHSKFREKLSQFWNRTNWEWIHDIPEFHKSCCQEVRYDKWITY
ncbi:MAG: HNH endonuclease [Nostoc sp.]